MHSPTHLPGSHNGTLYSNEHSTSAEYIADVPPVMLSGPVLAQKDLDCLWCSSLFHSLLTRVRSTITAVDATMRLHLLHLNGFLLLKGQPQPNIFVAGAQGPSLKRIFRQGEQRIRRNWTIPFERLLSKTRRLLSAQSTGRVCGLEEPSWKTNKHSPHSLHNLILPLLSSPKGPANKCYRTLLAGPRLYGATRKMAYMIWMKRHVLAVTFYWCNLGTHDHVFSEVLKTYIHSETAAAKLESVVRTQSYYVQFLTHAINYVSLTQILKQEPIMSRLSTDTVNDMQHTRQQPEVCTC